MKAAVVLKQPSPVSGQQASQAPKQLNRSMQNSVHSLVYLWYPSALSVTVCIVCPSSSSSASGDMVIDAALGSSVMGVLALALVDTNCFGSSSATLSGMAQDIWGMRCGVSTNDFYLFIESLRRYVCKISSINIRTLLCVL